MRKKICLVTTTTFVVRFFLVSILNALAEENDVTLIVNVDWPEELKQLNPAIKVVHLPIQRNISLLHDLRALIQLTFFLIKSDFDLIETVAPKAGLIGIVAGFVARVPIRLHIFQGEVWFRRTGFMRWLLKSLDRLVAVLATDLLVVSETERQFLISEGILSAAKSKVLGQGSICGVDLKRFSLVPETRNQSRNLYKYAEDDIVFAFIGRLNRDKGLYELFAAFELLNAQTAQNVRLLLVGTDEENIISESKNWVSAGTMQKISFAGYTQSPEKLLSAADVLVLPSQREGFGLVVIEAAALGLPAIGSDIYGIQDAMVNGLTGLLFRLNDVQDLALKMKQLTEDKVLRHKLGSAAKARCYRDFSQDVVTHNHCTYVAGLLVGQSYKKN